MKWEKSCQSYAAKLQLKEKKRRGSACEEDNTVIVHFPQWQSSGQILFFSNVNP